MMSDPLFLGDELISSQHLIGATKWEKISDEEIISHHQSRAAHQRFEDVRRKDVAVKGHGHGTVTTFFKKIDGQWKWGGIQTKVIWNEFEFERVFRGAAGKE
jgi:scytalone dehydratase